MARDVFVWTDMHELMDFVKNLQLHQLQISSSTAKPIQ